MYTPNMSCGGAHYDALFIVFHLPINMVSLAGNENRNTPDSDHGAHDAPAGIVFFSYFLVLKIPFLLYFLQLFA